MTTDPSGLDELSRQWWQTKREHIMPCCRQARDAAVAVAAATEAAASAAAESAAATADATSAPPEVNNVGLVYLNFHAVGRTDPAKLSELDFQSGTKQVLTQRRWMSTSMETRKWMRSPDTKTNIFSLFPTARFFSFAFMTAARENV
ncbi:hypothetical protein BRADI_1g75327v3 [Brachypodium distachyon]|uniref:Uncharacterized protein n=1 Tax=Brachypodium distachyon TaxID=15368 RepID=A0A2K2DV98_BRADI|nr:hypothetical protein BRADI_1g75327v3 [Brachypodium distachyon]PNT78208.1 hypothetical protein BRADI_1g75327v3 [Brachypodium distachyon]